MNKLAIYRYIHDFAEQRINKFLKDIINIMLY